MIRNAEHLALFIKKALEKRNTCRIYQDALDLCWFIPGRDGRKLQSDQIAAFARENAWAVRIHTPGGYGIVADFEAVAAAERVARRVSEIVDGDSPSPSSSSS